MRIGNLISGLLLIVAGELLFLANLGYCSWVSFYELSKWWPVLLIIFGFGILSKGRVPYLIAYLIVILSVGSVGVYAVQTDRTENNTTSAKSSISITRQQYSDVKKGHLSLDYGGGKLSVASGGTGDLLKGQFNNKPVVNNVSANLETLNVDLQPSGHAWFPAHNKIDHWQLLLSPDITWLLDIDTGAVDGNIDLTGIPLQRLNCDIGAGNINFKLGNNGTRSKLNIEAGASNVTLQIPNDTGVSILIDGALKADNLDTLGWDRIDNKYYSPNYQQAISKVDCDIDISAGNLDVQY
ncbi:MAG TPA: hypothetical protein DD811_10590 [Syntrophomonas sp.]|jgi:hypothetical protein|nr:hypothetical protein [Syntrophomonas sp.]